MYKGGQRSNLTSLAVQHLYIPYNNVHHLYEVTGHSTSICDVCT